MPVQRGQFGDTAYLRLTVKTVDVDEIAEETVGWREEGTKWGRAQAEGSLREEEEE